MYCANCGVKLADSEIKCPLCGTKAYHPDIPRTPGKPLYPKDHMPPAEVNPKVMPVMVMLLFLVPLITTLLSDLRINDRVTWSGYVVGSLLVGYVWLGLPMWFQKPNPVIFVPCGFAAAILFLLYINFATEGNWFLPFAFPVAGGIGLIVSALLTLLRYVHRGKLYIWGGACVAMGIMVQLVEFLICQTFYRPFTGWSIYSLVTALALGGFLIYLAINKAAREMMERKLFI